MIYPHTYMYIRKLAHIHIYTQTHNHTYTQTSSLRTLHINERAHAYMHHKLIIQTHAQAHRYIHKHTHTHSNKPTCMLMALHIAHKVKYTRQAFMKIKGN